MAEPRRVKELSRADVEVELTVLLRHGYGFLTIKIHGHRIAALETTIQQRRGSGELNAIPSESQ